MSDPNRVHSSATKYEQRPSWYVENGLRKVKPYIYAYKTFVKERWYGRTILDVFSTDFRDRSPAYYAKAIDAGIIQVDNERVSPDHILRNGEQLTNVAHRHEPPVTSAPVRILHRDDERGLLVVEKPGSMPIHSTGRYNYNTLLSILKFDHGLPMVHTLNRLDRLTSGIMVTALTPEATKSLACFFGTEGAVHKEYVARCTGRFPDGEIVCDEPLLTIDRQVALNIVHPEGRHAKTVFKRLSYDQSTDSSVVHCHPVTGRSHQIRVHLQFFGHPILNDSIYNCPSAFGTSLGKGGLYPEAPKRFTAQAKPGGSGESTFLAVAPAAPGPASEAPSSEVTSSPAAELSIEQARILRKERKRKELASRLGRGQYQGLNSPAPHGVDSAESGNSSSIALNDAVRKAVLELRGVRDHEDDFAREKDAVYADRMAWVRQAQANGDFADEGVKTDDEGLYCGQCGLPLLPDPKPEQLYIYLHALRYKTDAWDFSSPMPSWTRETDWQSPSAAPASDAS